MTRPLRHHPLWPCLDASSRQVLAAVAEPVAWRSAAELAQLRHGHALFGWLGDACALTLGAAVATGAASRPAAALPPGEGAGWRIAAPTLEALARGQQACEDFLAQAIDAPLAAPVPEDRATAPATSPTLRHAVGWLTAVGLPALVLAAVAGRSESWVPWACFCAALCAGLCVWVLGLAPPVVGALLALLLLVAGTHLPLEQAFAGFASGGFFLLLGMFACSTAIQSSGLTQRLLVTVLRPLPRTPRIFPACLMLVGTVMTLFITSTLGRLQLVAPMVKSLGSPGTRSYAPLAFAALSGTTLFSTSFLLGSAANFVVLGILPEHWQPHVNWMAWFQCAAVYTAVLATGLAASVVLDPATRDRAAATWTPPPLPRIGFTEGITALALLGLSGGAALGNLHHIDMAWLALFAMLLLMATGVLTVEKVHTGVNWFMLLYLACTVGIARSFTFMGIQPWLSEHAGGLELLMRTQQGTFLLLLVAVIALLRLVLPSMICVATSCAVLMPLADAHGLHPLVLGFVIVTASEIWFLPHQSSDFLLFRESVDLRADAQKGLLLRNAGIQLCRIAALAASVPYWHRLGFVQ